MLPKGSHKVCLCFFASEGSPICTRPLDPICAAAAEGRVEDLRPSFCRFQRSLQRSSQQGSSKSGSWSLASSRDFTSFKRRFLSAEAYGVAVSLAHDSQNHGRLVLASSETGAGKKKHGNVDSIYLSLSLSLCLST